MDTILYMLILAIARLVVPVTLILLIGSYFERHQKATV